MKSFHGSPYHGNFLSPGCHISLVLHHMVSGRWSSVPYLQRHPITGWIFTWTIHWTIPLAQRTLVEHFTFEGWLPNDFHDQRRRERCKVSRRIRQEKDGWMGTKTEHWTGVAINLHQQTKSAAAVTVTDPSLCMRSLGLNPTPLAVGWPHLTWHLNGVYW